MPSCSERPFLFPEPQLDEALKQDLRRMNPWWTGDAQVTDPRIIALPLSSLMLLR